MEQQNLASLEKTFNTCLDIISKIKCQQFLIKEKEAYLEAYDRKSFFEKTLDDGVTATLLLHKHKTIVEVLTKELHSLIGCVCETAFELENYESAMA